MSQRGQEWAVARNAPETRSATILFAKFRRTTQSLVEQPCATNPARLCANPGVGQAAWLEHPIFTALHWCHHTTDAPVKAPTDKKGPAQKREWEHYDRYKAGAFIKPVDECAWPKRTVWPLPPPSLTSFRADGKALRSPWNGGKASVGGKKDHKAADAAAASWASAAAHPCFLASIEAAVAAAAAIPGGDAVGLAAAANWVQNEWTYSTAEEARIRGDTEASLPAGHAGLRNVDPLKRLQGVLAEIIKKAPAVDARGRCAVPEFGEWAGADASAQQGMRLASRSPLS